MFCRKVLQPQTNLQAQSLVGPFLKYICTFKIKRPFRNIHWGAPVRSVYISTKVSELVKHATISCYTPALMMIAVTMECLSDCEISAGVSLFSEFEPCRKSNKWFLSGPRRVWGRRLRPADLRVKNHFDVKEEFKALSLVSWSSAGVFIWCSLNRAVLGGALCLPDAFLCGLLRSDTL